MPGRKGLLAPQNTFLDTIATRFDGTRKSSCDFSSLSRPSSVKDDLLAGTTFLQTINQSLKETRNPAIAEGPRDAGAPVEIW